MSVPKRQESYDTDDDHVPAESFEDDEDTDLVAEVSGDPDVLLDVPLLKVDEIHIEVDDLRARVSLQAEVLDLLKLNVGADVLLGKVAVDVKGVEAQALLKVRLDRVATIVGRVLTTIDRNPQILERLTAGLGEAVGEVGHGAGTAVGEVGRGAGTAVEDVGHGARKAVGEVGKGAGAAVGDVGRGAGRSVEKVGQGAGAAVGEVGRGAGRSVEKVGQGAGAAVGDVGRGAGSAARDAGRSTAGAVEDVQDATGRVTGGENRARDRYNEPYEKGQYDVASDERSRGKLRRRRQPREERDPRPP